MAGTYFITGIRVEVGKTIASAIVTEALYADYLKPILAGFRKKKRDERLNFQRKGNYCESILVNCKSVLEAED